MTTESALHNEFIWTVFEILAKIAIHLYDYFLMNRTILFQWANFFKIFATSFLFAFDKICFVLFSDLKLLQKLSKK